MQGLHKRAALVRIATVFVQVCNICTFVPVCTWMQDLLVLPIGTRVQSLQACASVFGGCSKAWDEEGRKSTGFPKAGWEEEEEEGALLCLCCCCSQHREC